MEGRFRMLHFYKYNNFGENFESIIKSMKEVIISNLFKKAYMNIYISRLIKLLFAQLNKIR